MSISKNEMFLDTSGLSNISGVTQSINLPVKSGISVISPITGEYVAGAFVSVIHRADLHRYEMYYKCYADAAMFSGVPQGSCFYTRVAYASDVSNLKDPASWTTPSLGLVTYNGSTTNNIIKIAAGSYNGIAACHSDVIYDATLSKYVLLLGNWDSSTCAWIYTSTDGVNFTLTKDIEDGLYGTCIRRKADGKWIMYYQTWDGVRREIGAYTSSDDNLAGTWTDLGLIWTATPIQQHTVGMDDIDGVQIHYPMAYDATRPGDVRLLKSTDYVTLTEINNSPWIGHGGTIDKEGLYNPSNVTWQGDKMYWFYGAMPKTFADSQPWNITVTVAELGYKRIGQVAGTGTFKLSDTLTTKLPLYLNCSSGVKIQIEDTAGDPITGYAFADCAAIPAGYQSEVRWGSVGLQDLQSANYKISAQLTNGTIYALNVGRDERRVGMAEKTFKITIPASTGDTGKRRVLLPVGSGMTANFWSNVAANGSDVYIYDSTGTRIDHHIVAIDTASTKWECWVYADPNTFVTVKCGTGVTNSANTPANVNDANDLMFISCEGSASPLADSSANGNNLSTAVGSPTFAQSGKIGKSAQLASTAGLSKTSNAGISGLSSFTYSQWFKSDGTVQTGDIAGKFGIGDQAEWATLYRHTTTSIDLIVSGNLGATVYIGRRAPVGNFLDGNFHKLDFTLFGTTAKIMVDGVRKDDTDFSSGSFVSMPASTAPLEVGLVVADVASALPGYVDTVRYRNTAISEARSLFEYQNQNAPDTFLTVQEIVPQSASGSKTGFSLGFGLGFK
jgi:hypothetical protein